MAGGVTVAYAGIHQAFQLALAAEEIHALTAFHCSIFDAPGKWGRLLARAFGRDALANRRVDGVPLAKIHEHPWPLLRQRVRARLRPTAALDLLAAHDAFDRTVARALDRTPTPVFLGTETCAQRAFEVCTRRGLHRILDCPQLHPRFLTAVLDEAAALAKLPGRAPVDTPGMAARKDTEYAAADRLLIYSEVHRRSFTSAGFADARLFECPLWVDPNLWFPDPSGPPPRGEKLRVLFVGGINLRKGVPFLLEAARTLGSAIELTLVGALAAELSPMISAHRDRLRLVQPQTRAALRSTYAQHDVLVLPSIADSFGFVGLEAMACGLPVVVTENCGVPVPDPAWRVPAMSAPALVARLTHYLDDRDALAADRNTALAFAAPFTPARYRREIGALLTASLPR
jgi:glycosyltransferase involved in cell wall biosynthesis